MLSVIKLMIDMLGGFMLSVVMPRPIMLSGVNLSDVMVSVLTPKNVL